VDVEVPESGVDGHDSVGVALDKEGRCSPFLMRTSTFGDKEKQWRLTVGEELNIPW
jgi:hypothetical protein